MSSLELLTQKKKQFEIKLYKCIFVTPYEAINAKYRQMARIKRVTKPKRFQHMFSLLVTDEQMDKLQSISDKKTTESGQYVSMAEVVRHLIDAHEPN